MRELHTGIYIHDPVDIDALWDFAMIANLNFADEPRTLADCPYVTDVETQRENALIRIPRPVFPLPVHMCMWYRNDGPVQTAEETEQLHANCPNKPKCDNDSRHSPAHHVLIGMTTSYMYADIRRWDVGDLHAAMLWAIGGYLNTQSVPWSWTNELTDGIHMGDEALGDPLDRLKAMGKLAATQARAEFMYSMGLASPWGNEGDPKAIIVNVSEIMKKMFGDQDGG